MRPPKDIQRKGIIWKVVKPIYGLKDSAHNWYATLKIELTDLGCIQSSLDPTVFIYRRENSLKGLFICHVDDFLFSVGDKDFNCQVIDRLKEKYDISSENVGSFTYVGLHLDKIDSGIMMSQNEYVNSVKSLSLKPWANFKNDDVLDDAGIAAYQSLVGKLNWLAHQSRPDLSFYAYNYSLFSKKPLFVI